MGNKSSIFLLSMLAESLTSPESLGPFIFSREEAKYSLTPLLPLSPLMHPLILASNVDKRISAAGQGKCVLTLDLP